jgi:hypothetical protein
MSLHSTLLAAAWPALPEALRAAHRDRPTRLVGVATVERGRGWIARFGGWLAGLPEAAADATLTVRLSDTPAPAVLQESWERRFGRSRPMTSRLRQRDGLLVERLGAATLAFQLEARDGRIHWHARSVHLFGVRMPASWLSGIEASEFVDGGQYAFDVRVGLPGIGLVVHYRGRLALITSAGAPG